MMAPTAMPMDVIELSDGIMIHPCAPGRAAAITLPPGTPILHLMESQPFFAFLCREAGWIDRIVKLNVPAAGPAAPDLNAKRATGLAEPPRSLKYRLVTGVEAVCAKPMRYQAGVLKWPEGVGKRTGSQRLELVALLLILPLLGLFGTGAILLDFLHKFCVFLLGSEYTALDLEQASFETELCAFKLDVIRLCAAANDVRQRGEKLRSRLDRANSGSDRSKFYHSTESHDGCLATPIVGDAGRPGKLGRPADACGEVAP